MKNEIGRKLTSLTLMTIMVAGGLTFAVPGIIPAAYAANANLFVSAENSAYDNYFAGPMVIEVVIIDPDIDDTDEGKGEPDVTVNGKDIRMVQAVDGNWYAYFADRLQAQTADALYPRAEPGLNTNATGMNFGLFCDNDAGNVLSRNVVATAIVLTDTVGFAIPGNTTTLATTADGADVITDADTCDELTTGAFVLVTSNVTQNVIRENKALNPGPGIVNPGQIGIDATYWPFIQLYNFNPTGNVIVQYNKGGGVQSTTLTFDTVDQFANLDLDRAKYPQNAQVHLTLTDVQLNIDPTDEDSWTFGAGNGTTFYQLFNENGGINSDGTGGAADIATGKTSLMFEDNGVFLLNTNTQSASNVVILLDDNDDSILTTGSVNRAGQNSLNTRSINATDLPVTFTELSANSGIFANYDESDDANLIISGNALRGTSATVDYNEVPRTVLVGFDFATIDIQALDDEWGSGEEIPVVLVDADANLNSHVDEDLDLNNPAVTLIPSLQIGDPFTLGEAGNSVDDGANTIQATFFSELNRVQANKASSTNVRVLDLNSGFGANPGANITATVNVDKFSAIGRITTTLIANTTALIIDLETTAGELFASITDPAGTLNDAARFHGFNLLNIDVRSINTTLTTVDVWLLNATTGTQILDAGGDIPRATPAQVAAGGAVNSIKLATGVNLLSLTSLNATAPFVAALDFQGQLTTNLFDMTATDNIGLMFNYTVVRAQAATFPVVADFFTFGFTGDGVLTSERTGNQIIRLELEETGDNTSTFTGSLEYQMLNQITILDINTYTGGFFSTINDDPTFILIEDFTDEDSPRVNYLDLGADGVSTQIADQEEGPTHSGVVSFDSSSYKIADTVVVTLEDQDLNTNTDLIDIFTVVNATGDAANDTVGRAGLPTLTQGPLGKLLDITFDDIAWTTSNAVCNGLIADTAGTGLRVTGFTLVETAQDSGVFTGDFQIPSVFCPVSATTGLPTTTTPVTTTGKDLEVNYQDFRDASGEIIEVGDSAGIRANTGSVSLDRTVYPVPFGELANFNGDTEANTPNSLSVFPVHATAIGVGTVDDDTLAGVARSETIGIGDVQIHIRINDPDFDISAAGSDVIAADIAGDVVGPLKITISRGADRLVLAYAGGSTANATGLIDVGDDGVPGCRAEAGSADRCIRQLGSMSEVAPDAGIFELDFAIRYTDGPASSKCPETPNTGNTPGFTTLFERGVVATLGNEDERFDTASPAGQNYCILQGDIITVEYTDPQDASGDVNTVTDSASFDLRNGVLQSDKSVYIIGGDMILTLIEPDFDLDNDAAETYDLDIIEWDSDAATITMGNLGGTKSNNGLSFDPEPTDFRETGDSTGIFQIVIEIPESLGGDNLERGEEVVLEYTDWGPSGSDFVGQEDEDINLTIFTSNFGATVELDQKVYSWTDKVYITIVAPDHNFDSDLIDQIGETTLDPIKVSTRGKSLDRYQLVETGTDTGIFTGEIILTGFFHDADGDLSTGADGTGTAPRGSDTNPRTGDATGQNPNERGPTDGFIETDDDDGITISFEFSEDETVVGSALIRWNIGETQWLEASYPASGTGVVRIVDPDMNLNPESVDNFDVDVWSDSDAGGIDLTVTETNEATGIFEGTVFFTTFDESSGHRLRVSEGDTITAEYEDNTLPDPYTTADELDITGTSLIGTIVPPLERAPAANARIVDAFGNALASVGVDQQVQITADLANGQDREQSFAYLVQVQDSNGVTISLAWITGSLAAGQSFSPALSWTPDAAGTYTATVFVWESVNNPTALSPPTSVDISVS